VKFRITVHSGFDAPADALELLWQRLGPRREETRFAKGGAEITATWGEDAPVSMERAERAVIGRRAVLDIVREICERSPELQSDWFAIGPGR